MTGSRPGKADAVVMQCVDLLSAGGCDEGLVTMETGLPYIL